MMQSPALAASKVWTLTEFGQGEGQKRTIELPRRDLIVGRVREADITVPDSGVSKKHARLTFFEDHLMVEDLGSTNGTYVNGTRVDRSILTEGDLLQFANAVYRIGTRQTTSSEGTLQESILPWAKTLILFEQMLTQRAVVPHFQAIVEFESLKKSGFELLARSHISELTNPGLMFSVAERLGQQARLSEIMREEGLKVAQASPHHQLEFYLNTHPREVINDRLIASLRDLRAEHPSAKIVVEIHEAAITDLADMKQFRTVLDELNMKLSYDDFGAGQGRLLELGEVPPDILKFDMRLIRGIDTAPGNRQGLLANLVRIAKELGTIPLAEGVETEGEHGVCRQMGFQLGQGFLYGYPQTF